MSIIKDYFLNNKIKLMEKYIEEYLNILAKKHKNDHQKAKECYLLAINIIMKEFDDHFQGWLTTDREHFWKSEIKKYGRN